MTGETAPKPNSRPERFAWFAEHVRPALAPFLASRLVCVLSVSLIGLAIDMRDERIPPKTGDSAAVAPRDPERFSGRNLLLDWTLKWDGGWYMGIVQGAYSYHAGQQSNVVFFPLFPLSIKALAFLGVPPMWGGFVVNNLAFFGALVYLHALGRLLLPDRASAERALWLLALFPTSFFFSAFYSESLYLLCCVAAVYHLQMRQWLPAVAFAALASACRIMGCMLYVILMLEWLRDQGWTVGRAFDADAWRGLPAAARRDWRRLALIQLSVAGLLAYMAFLYLEFGDPLLFQRLQSAWDRKFIGPWTTFRQGRMLLGVRDFTGSDKHGNPLQFHQFLDFLCYAGALVAGVGVWRRFGAGLGFFCLVSILIPACTGLMSISRFVVTLFPFFFWLAPKLSGTNAERATLVLFASLLAVLSVTFGWFCFVS